MRRNRKNNIRRERIIMITSSAFVLAALTMTGVYMKERNADSKNDGYMIDFTALENSVDDKYQEIAQNNTDVQNDNDIAQGNNVTGNVGEQTNMENDLDYMPMEAGSHLVEIPGLTDGVYSMSEENGNNEDEAKQKEEQEDGNEAANSEDNKEEESSDDDQTASGTNVVTKELHFSEENGLIRPSQGEVMMHYNMDGTIFFATLQQYKYNPAVMFYASEGDAVSACAEGKVVNVYKDAVIGNAVTLELGDGYQATYGQLKDIQVTTDSYVNPGETIGSVAGPTKYYGEEGCNLYFELTKDGTPVNPENLF